MKPTTNFEIEKVKPLLVKWMRMAVDTKEKAITSTVMITWINDKYKDEYILTGQRFRFLINEMRRNSEYPICANNRGYWITDDIFDVYETGISLIRRGSSVMMAGLGQLYTIKQDKKWIDYQKLIDEDMENMMKKYDDFFKSFNRI